MRDHLLRPAGGSSAGRFVCGYSDPMRLRLCTWNVNSVRLRHEQVARFVQEQAPDVICMQEIKCREGEFPTNAFVEMGLPHLRIKGQKGWHGVAIASISAGVWLTTRDMYLWFQTSCSPGATLRSPEITSGALGSRAAISAVSFS